MLSCNKISLKYNDNIIISELNHSFAPGSITIIRGENGSGKTSFLKALATILKIEQGDITWFGQNIYANTTYLSELCYIGHKLAIKEELTILENISFWAEIKENEVLMPVALTYFNLEKLMNIKTIDLSQGWQKRLALSRLMVTGTKIWLLDEPEVNLDIQAMELFLNLISIRADQGGIIIIASHDQTKYQNFEQYYLNNNI